MNSGNSKTPLTNANNLDKNSLNTGNIPKSQSSTSLSKLDKLTPHNSKKSESIKSQGQAELAMGGREAIALLLMKDREIEYTNFHNYRVYCATWNVNGQQAADVQHWLSPPEDDKEPPDIYAIGFQELDLSKNVYIFNESAREEDWIQRLEKALHPKAKYTRIKQVRLVAMLLVVYVNERLEKYISDVSSEYVGTGILGMMGNKGGVAIRMQLHATKICFVNSHLAAHMDEYSRRNQDFREISTRLVFRVGDRIVNISDHDLIFWIGDLNYRISGLDFEKCKSKIEQNKFDDLLKYDQLSQQISTGRAFLDYKEGQILFKPTYKYDTNSDQFDTSEKCRIPAWCDRILWRGDHIDQLCYRSHQKFLLSDHKPVSAIFNIGTKVYDLVMERKVREEVMKQLDQKENEFLPQVKLEPTEITFENVKFFEEQQKCLTIANTGQVPVQIEFINKPTDSYFCKPWLQVHPSIGFIHIGEKINIMFEVNIDSKSIGHIDNQHNTFEDILVLHLQGGKDFFITVGGVFLPGCFGSSINQLVQIRYPIATPEGIEAMKRSSIQEGEIIFDIPKELWFLVNFLNEYALFEENLFRFDGLDSEIRQIRNFLDLSVEVLPTSFGTHSVASAFIVFLNSFSEPVIPFKFYFAAVEARSLSHACMIVEKIPVSHRNVFQYVCAFLRKLLKYSDSNKLDIDFLSTIFGNILLRPPENSEEFFSKQPSDIDPLSKEGRRSRFIAWFLAGSN